MRDAAGTPVSVVKTERFSSERLYPATIFSFSDCAAARVSTRAQRPRPTIPTFTGSMLIAALASRPNIVIR